MSVYLLFRFLHILSAVMLVGGVIARQLARSAAARAQTPQAIAQAFSAADPIERYMVIPGSMLVLIFGIVLSLIAKAPIFGFLQGAKSNWLLVSIILLMITFALVPSVFLRRGKNFAKALDEAVKAGEITPALRLSLDDPVVRAAHIFEITAILVIVALMVFKPF